VRNRAIQLNVDPDKQGKELSGDLVGSRVVRAVRQQSTVIFRIEKKKVEVLVVGVGNRKEKDKHDIYALTKKFIGLGILDVP